MQKEYLHQSGAHKNKLNRNFVQTGSPRGTFKEGDPHPKYPKVLFISFNVKDSSERWRLDKPKKKIELKEKYLIKNLNPI